MQVEKLIKLARELCSKSVLIMRETGNLCLDISDRVPPWGLCASFARKFHPGSAIFIPSVSDLHIRTGNAITRFLFTGTLPRGQEKDVRDDPLIPSNIGIDPSLHRYQMPLTFTNI